MTILHRYILRLLIIPFLIGSITVVFLFLLQFLMKYIDQLVGKGLENWVIIQLIGLNLAWMVVLAVPMGILVATLMVYGHLGATHEITAVKAAGGSPWRVLSFTILTAAVIGIALFWFNDRVLPDANHRAKTLLYDIRRKKPAFALVPGQFYQQIEGYRILARSINPDTDWLYGITIYETRFADRLSVLSADSAQVHFTADFRYIVLKLYNGEIYQFRRNPPEALRKVRFSRHEVYLDGTGFLFSQSDEERFVRGDRELSIAAMRHIVREAEQKWQQQYRRWRDAVEDHLQYVLDGRPLDRSVRESGEQFPDVRKSLAQLVEQIRWEMLTPAQQMRSEQQRANRYRVEIHKKYAIPAACVIFALVGGALGMITRRGNFGVSAAISLGFYILYWALLIGGEKLADRGIIAPWLGMWSANILIGSGGLLLLWYLMNEHWRWR